MRNRWGVVSPEEPVEELRRVPIAENGEPLIDFAELCPRIVMTPVHPVFEYGRFRVARKSLAEKLAQAASSLPDGLQLAIVECWRPPAIQREMFAATHARLQRQHPEWDAAELRRMTERTSAPMDEHVPPPHTTGGAVDLHLLGPDGQILDFTSPYGLLDPHGAPFDAPGLTPEARRNRQLLWDTLTAVGITNYPSEWWHWSYGDQGWAYRGDHPHALYGAIEPPGLADADFTFREKENPGWG
jgi:D-alanyl-D-alanine dipeptidase